MAEFTITVADIVVVLVLLLSAGYAVYRGVIRETLWVFAWALAGYAALLFGPAAAHVLEPALESPWLRYPIGYALVFAAVFIPLSFIGQHLKQTVQKTPIGPVDRILGFGFGLARGLVLVCAVYLVFDAFVPLREQPRWLTEARLYPLVSDSSEVLRSLIPDQDRDPVAELAAPASRTRQAPARRAAAERESGYDAGDRRALERLIESSGGR
jgi:membrane protein required for colicin V production